MTAARPESGWSRQVRWLLTAVAAAILAAAFLVVDQRLDLSVATQKLVVWWWLRILLVYASIVLLARLIIELGPAQLRSRRARALGVVAWLGYLTVVLALNVRLVAVLENIAQPRRGALLSASILALATLALAPVRGAAWGVARAFFCLAGGVILYFGLGSKPSLAAAPPPAALEAAVAARKTPPLLVLGLDGADWRLIDELERRGLVPNLARLRRDAAWGELDTLKPTLSPLIWTTVVTGRPPERHGVMRLQVDRPAGLGVGTQGRNIRVAALGLPTLRDLLLRVGQLVRGPVTASERRVPALWTIASYFSKPTSVVSWWATWPAEPIVGQIVSDRVFYDRAWAQEATDNPDERLTYPETLATRMRRLAVRPDDIDFDYVKRFLDISPAEFEEFRRLKYAHHDIRSEFRLYLSMFASDRQFVRELIREEREEGRPLGDLLVLFRLVDHASHCCLKYSDLDAGAPGISDDDRRRFGRFTLEAYREADAALGEILAAREWGNVVVLSDHGFALEGNSRRPQRFAHTSGPPGIFLGAGPAFRKGRFDGLSVYDLMPLLLYLRGLPVADDLEGKFRTDLLDAEYLALQPPLSVPSLEFVPVVPQVSRASRSDAEILDELRALGYIK